MRQPKNTPHIKRQQRNINLLFIRQIYMYLKELGCDVMLEKKSLNINFICKGCSFAIYALDVICQCVFMLLDLEYETDEKSHSAIKVIFA